MSLTWFWMKVARARSALLAITFMLTVPMWPETNGIGVASAQTAYSTSCIFDQQTLWTPAKTCRPRAISYPAGVVGKVKRAIYDSSLIFGTPYALLLRIARCESSLNPHANNGSHFGLYQFLPDTFRLGAGGLRKNTGIVARTVWSPQDASYVAGYLFALGQAPQWSCR